MVRLRHVAAVSLALLVGCGSTHRAAHTPDRDRTALRFVATSPHLRAICRAAALRVGYPVPCPTRVPAGLTATGVAGPTGCSLDIVSAGGLGGCARSWRGWVVGSSTVGRQHLVITASPRPLRSYAKVVNGPAW